MRFSFSQFQGSAAVAAKLTVCLIAGLSCCRVLASEAPAASEPSLSIFAPAQEQAAESDAKPARRDFDLPDRPDSIGDLFGGNRGARSAPMPRPRPQPQRKQRSILDDPGNWGFITTEDVVQEYTSRGKDKTPLIMPDGRDWNSLSPVERYYERQMRGRSAASSDSGADAPTFGSSFNFNEFSPAIFSAPPDHSMRPSLPGALTQPTQNEALSDLLGFRRNPFTPEAIRQREANHSHMEAFRRALDVQPHQPVAAAAPTPTAQGFNPAVQNSLNNPFGLSAGAGNPYLSSVTPSSPEAPRAPTAPLAPSQFDTSAQQSPSRLLPTRPDFSLPQRRF